MFTKRMLGAVIVVALMVAANVASGNALTILPTAGSLQEHSGDPGGSTYPWIAGPGGGAGVPWQTRTTTGGFAAGWPTGPGMAGDPSFPQSLGTSGWDAAYLWLEQPGFLTFQFMGGGDSGYPNSFWVDFNGSAAGGWTLLFQDPAIPQNPPAGSLTDPCPVAPGGATLPDCNNRQVAGGAAAADHSFNQYTFYFDAGLIPFAFDIDGLGGPVNDPNSDWNWGGANTSACVNGTGNPSDDSNCAGFFLGVDPYLATAPQQLSGPAVYIGLSDRPRSANGVVFDHDYQDMGVRVSVAPEPGTAVLVGLGLAGLGFALRRKLD
jgi:hypothetical protein